MGLKATGTLEFELEGHSQESMAFVLEDFRNLFHFINIFFWKGQSWTSKSHIFHLHLIQLITIDVLIIWIGSSTIIQI